MNGDRDEPVDSFNLSEKRIILWDEDAETEIKPINIKKKKKVRYNPHSS